MSSLIIRPEVSEAAEKAKRNALQNERRQIARGLLPYIIDSEDGYDSHIDVGIALEYADTLLQKTKLED